ncbi:MAG: glycerol-3-phosphate dehydrogenase/oxidase [Aureispira sp.]|nr:glycerol-3-phosphate dehydrogenase/oxidase [Aureispira sp.]
MSKIATPDFSIELRAKTIEKLSTEKFDLIIIGGGITGAGIALDATTRGIKTLLVEKKDFGWGTSSRSTKLIHGGLRYLKQFDFGLVHEVGVERAIVHHNAPHVVIPEKMLLPIVDGGSLGKRLSSVGLWIYDRLAGVEKDERRQMLPLDKTQELEPLLRKDILQGGGLYYEYRTDDARLTIEVIKTAVAHGATCINYAEVVDFIYKENGFVEGIQLKDHLSNQKIEVRSRRIVNAAGPWVDTIRNIDDEGVKGSRLQLTKGVHIVIPKDRLPIKQSIYFDVNTDSRMCFAIPRGNITYIGTTDTLYSKEINTPIASRQDVEYILNATNYMFPSAKLTINDVESTWAGLRPLIHQEGKDPSELSRKDEIFFSKTGLYSIAGGKLTGYRKMAERVMKVVCKSLENKEGCKTKHLKLIGGQFESDEALDTFIYKRTGEAKQIGATSEQIIALSYKYGSDIDKVIEKAFELYGTIQDPNLLLLAAEIWYGVKYEMVSNLCDFIIRRTGRLYFERPSLETLLPFISGQLATLLNWTEEQKAEALEEFDKEYKTVMQFRNEK